MFKGVNMTKNMDASGLRGSHAQQTWDHSDGKHSDGANYAGFLADDSQTQGTNRLLTV
jgi:hypothetical protein